MLWGNNINVLVNNPLIDNPFTEESVWFTAVPPPPTGSNLVTEDGDYFISETGSFFVTE